MKALLENKPAIIVLGALLAGLVVVAVGITTLVLLDEDLSPFAQEQTQASNAVEALKPELGLTHRQKTCHTIMGIKQCEYTETKEMSWTNWLWLLLALPFVGKKFTLGKRT